MFGPLPQPSERQGPCGSPGTAHGAFPECCSVTYLGLSSSSRTGPEGTSPERVHQLPKVTQLSDRVGI